LKTISFILALAIAFCLTPLSRGQNGLTTSERAAMQALAEATVTLDQAMQRAAEQDMTAVPARAYLTMKDNKACWGVEVVAGEYFRTFWVDGKTGAFIRSEERRADGSAQRHRMFHEQGGVGYAEASRIALGEFENAKAHDVRSNLSGEALTYDVYLMQGERPVWVRVDASGGIVQKGDAPRPLQKKKAG
jgi:uncharacterized membrane protein YkoI